MRTPEDADIRIENVQCRGIVLKDDQILLMFRRKKGREYYVLPGGHMEKGEKPIDTVIREVKEETTVEVSNFELAFEFKNHKDKDIEKLEYYFVGKWKSGEPTLSGEESRETDESNYYEPIWVSLTDVPRLKLYSGAVKEWIVNSLNKYLKERD
ncbi:MAG: NUDIX domain-containing protein [Candidatus Dojkabacteria bacterium]|nr:NUDIX domain-containing protein [Candidatus Dojkabacteria bacterium]